MNLNPKNGLVCLVLARAASGLLSVTKDFAGSADKVTLSAPGAASSVSYFDFLPDMSGFYVLPSADFSRFELLYRKTVQ